MKKTFTTLTVATLKGGVGKSTLAVSMAGELSLRGKSCLLIDADPQANSSNFMKLDETNEGYVSILDIFRNPKINPQDVVKHTEFDNFDIIGSTILLTAVEKQMYRTDNSEQVLKAYLDKNKEFFNNYDYIIFDTNPSMSKVNQASLVAADKILCVSGIGKGSYKGIELFDYLLGELNEEVGCNAKIDAVVLNQYKKIGKLSRDYIDYIQNDDFVSNMLLKSMIKDATKLAQAEEHNTPICYYAPSSTSAKEIKAVVDELIQRKVL